MKSTYFASSFFFSYYFNEELIFNWIQIILSVTAEAGSLYFLMTSFIIQSEGKINRARREHLCRNSVSAEAAIWQI